MEGGGVLLGYFGEGGACVGVVFLVWILVVWGLGWLWVYLVGV